MQASRYDDNIDVFISLTTYVLGIQKNRLNEMAFWAPKTCLTYALGIQKNRLNEMAFWAPKTCLTWRI